MPVLEVRGLTVDFGGVRALDDVDLSVEGDEIVGLLGPNGAGKTTFFNCVSGFVRPSRGRVWVKDRDVTRLGPHKRAELGLGRTFQHVGLVGSWTVRDNVMAAQHLGVGYGLVAGLAGTPAARAEERELRERTALVLDFMGLVDVAEQRVEALPYGLQKMSEVAAVLATNPDTLVLDEPLAGTAPEEADAFTERLLRMRRELQLTIVMIEHNVPAVLRTADYVYVLNFGQLLAEGSPEEIRADPAVAQAYMGEGAVTLG